MMLNKTLNKVAYFLILIHSQSHMVENKKTWAKLFAEQEARLQQKQERLRPCEDNPYTYWKVSEYYSEKRDAIIAMHKKSEAAEIDEETLKAALTDVFWLGESSNIVASALAMRKICFAEKTTYVEDLVNTGVYLAKKGEALREDFDLGIFLGLDILAQTGTLKFDADILHPEQNLQMSKRDFDRIIYALIIVKPICEEPSSCLKKIKTDILETLAPQLREAANSLNCSEVEVKNMNECLSRHLP